MFRTCAKCRVCVNFSVAAFGIWTGTHVWKYLRTNPSFADFQLTSTDPSIGIPRLIYVKPPPLAQLPVTLTDPFKIQTPALSVGQLDERNGALSQWPTDYQTLGMDAVSRGGATDDPQIVTELGRLICQMSNKLSTGIRVSTGMRVDNHILVARLAAEIKILAESTSSWKCLLAGGRGPTSKSLIEQLFEFSITNKDITLAKMMLEIGADPNQEIGYRCSALDFAVTEQSKGLIDLLVNSGAVYGQMSLKHAVFVEDFDLADRMLHSDSSLDLNFNYINEKDMASPYLGFLEVETLDLVGFVCTLFAGVYYYHDEAILSANEERKIHVLRHREVEIPSRTRRCDNPRRDDFGFIQC